ncbi:fungal fruit body lectin [Chaetomium sp. MPI-CAGE-AT-0009]|nr:fungal fruit body lectin [Chaetomium sp. MPI-CAGE-AT-0009]
MPAYQLQLFVINHSAAPSLIEQSCWQNNNTTWTTDTTTTAKGATLTTYTLSMDESGSSGMLRFRTQSGTIFAVAIGVHNFERWCDVQVNLTGDNPLTKLHARYYDEADELYQKLWAQSTEASGVLNNEGHEAKVGFYKTEGQFLAGYLAYFPQEPQETGQGAPGDFPWGGIRSILG